MTSNVKTRGGGGGSGRLMVNISSSQQLCPVTGAPSGQADSADRPENPGRAERARGAFSG